MIRSALVSRDRLFRGWWVVVGSGTGIAFGSSVLFAAGFPQLSHAWAQAFGWSQTQLAQAGTVFLLSITAGYPLAGYLANRWGSRAIASASIVAFAVSLLLLSQVGGSLTQLYLACGFMGLVAAGTNVVGYAQALSQWFDRKLGLAIGLAASAQSIGVVSLPILIAHLVGGIGWSGALMWLAALQLLVCLPVVALLVRNSPAPFGLRADGAGAPAPAHALSQNSAAARPSSAGAQRAIDEGTLSHSANLWKLIAAFIVLGFVSFAIIFNLVFILADTAKMSALEVAKVQALAGVGAFAGRIGFGHMLDKMGAALTAIVVMAVLALSCVLLATGGSPALVLLGGFLAGAAGGGESDLMPYFARRYFGAQKTSKVFGLLLAAFSIGGAVGVTAFAAVAAWQGSSATALYLFAATLIVPLAIFVSFIPHERLQRRKTLGQAA